MSFCKNSVLLIAKITRAVRRFRFCDTLLRPHNERTSNMGKVSAGLLMYRKRNQHLEVLLVHLGGPFWAKKDAGAWFVPKGEVNPGEDELSAAKREFQEETGLVPGFDFFRSAASSTRAAKPCPPGPSRATAIPPRCAATRFRWSGRRDPARRANSRNRSRRILHRRSRPRKNASNRVRVRDPLAQGGFRK